VKLNFAYDAQGRRIRKQVFAWTGSAWATTPASDLRFLYDGWNLLAEYNALASNAVVRTHVWGLDLSGSEQGAGGVGGLLWTISGSAAHAPGYDANGNVVAWVDLANGTVTGRRDYGAFGETLLATGNAASQPFAFSTKYRDAEIDLYYYGFRYYNPFTGRWPSRDPIEEVGGLNLYEMVGNNAVTNFDKLGQFGFWPPTPSGPNLHFPAAPSSPDHLATSGESFNNTAWFERKYPGWIDNVKATSKDRINAWIKANCGSSPFEEEVSFPVFPYYGTYDGENRVYDSRQNETQYGDAPQSPRSADKVLGAFQFVLDTPVVIEYDFGRGARLSFKWKATIVIKDVLGFQKENDAKGAFLLTAFPSRVATRGSFTINGSGLCCY
jgi:RHS repeat-associated protein